MKKKDRENLNQNPETEGQVNTENGDQEKTPRKSTRTRLKDGWNKLTRKGRKVVCTAASVTTVALVLGIILTPSLIAYGKAETSYAKRIGNVYYQAFGLENNHANANTVGASTANYITNRGDSIINEGLSSGFLKITRSYEQNQRLTQYNANAQAHLDNIKNLLKGLSGKENVSVDDVNAELSKITGWSTPTIKAEPQANRAEETQEKALAERYLWLANVAAAKAADLDFEIDVLVEQENLNPKDEKVKELKNGVQAIYDYVDSLEAQANAEGGSVTLEDLKAMTDDDAMNDPAGQIDYFIGQFNELKNEVTPTATQNLPDPSVEDWQDNWFDNKGANAKGGLENVLRGNNMIDITGVVKSDDALMQGVDTYNKTERELTVLLKTNKQDQYCLVTLDLSKAEQKEYTGDELADLIAKADSPVKVDSTVYKVVENGGQKLLVACKTNVVTDPDTGITSTTITGNVFQGSFAGPSQAFTFSVEGNHRADAQNLLVQRFVQANESGLEA